MFTILMHTLPWELNSRGNSFQLERRYFPILIIRQIYAIWDRSIAEQRLSAVKAWQNAEFCSCLHRYTLSQVSWTTFNLNGNQLGTVSA